MNVFVKPHTPLAIIKVIEIKYQNNCGHVLATADSDFILKVRFHLETLIFGVHELLEVYLCVVLDSNSTFNQA